MRFRNLFNWQAVKAQASWCKCEAHQRITKMQQLEKKSPFHNMLRIFMSSLDVEDSHEFLLKSNPKLLRIHTDMTKG